MILNLIIVGLFIIFIVIGFVKGFIKQLLGIAGTILAIVLAVMFCKPTVELLKNTTPVYAGLHDWIAGILPSIDKSTIESYPVFLQNIFAPILNDSAQAIETVSDTLTTIILSAAVFVVISLLVKILVFVLVKILHAIISKTPLSAINRIIGAGVGLIKGLLFVSALLYVLGMYIPLTHQLLCYF